MLVKIMLLQIVHWAKIFQLTDIWQLSLILIIVQGVMVNVTQLLIVKLHVVNSQPSRVVSSLIVHVMSSSVVHVFVKETPETVHAKVFQYNQISITKTTNNNIFLIISYF